MVKKPYLFSVTPTGPFSAGKVKGERVEKDSIDITCLRNFRKGNIVIHEREYCHFEKILRQTDFIGKEQRKRGKKSISNM